MLGQELKGDAKPALVLARYPLVLEVGARRHPAVNLIGEGLDVLGDRQAGLKLLDGLGVLVLGGEQRQGDLDARGVLRVDHGRVDRDGGLEGVIGRGDGERDDLAAPAELGNGK